MQDYGIPNLESQNEDRMRRANSWLSKSKRAKSSAERFIFLWIAFNAAYGRRCPLDGSRPKEIHRLKEFFDDILKLDKRRLIRTTLKSQYANSGPVRRLLENKYVYSEYWKYVRNEPTEFSPRRFRERADEMGKALEWGRFSEALMEVFDRLYTLRIQIVHGGVTYGKGAGGKQLRDGSRVMGLLVPLILDVMRDDITKKRSTSTWGRIDYPRHSWPEEEAPETRPGRSPQPPRR